ncbi:MAG: hypothetical protein LBH62_05275 [Nitrososphaerota archaeon]|jgi:hypothetical protein|nr:hypothetical protein [Nitrososphaerota archaeon]
MAELNSKTKRYLKLVLVYVCIAPAIWLVAFSKFQTFVSTNPVKGFLIYGTIIAIVYGSLCVIYYVLTRKLKLAVPEFLQIGRVEFYLFIVIPIIIGVASCVASIYPFIEIITTITSDNISKVNEVISGLLTITSILFVVQVAFYKKSTKLIRRVSFIVVMIVELDFLGNAAYSYLIDLSNSNSLVTLYSVFLSLLFTLLNTGYFIALNAILPQESEKEC